MSQYRTESYHRWQQALTLSLLMHVYMNLHLYTNAPIHMQNVYTRVYVHQMHTYETNKSNLFKVLKDELEIMR